MISVGLRTDFTTVEVFSDNQKRVKLMLFAFLSCWQQNYGAFSVGVSQVQSSSSSNIIGREPHLEEKYLWDQLHPIIPYPTGRFFLARFPRHCVPGYDRRVPTGTLLVAVSQQPLSEHRAWSPRRASTTRPPTCPAEASAKEEKLWVKSVDAIVPASAAAKAMDSQDKSWEA
jgi:hypothetical protein